MARIPVAKGSRGRDAQDDTLDGGQDARCTRPRAGVGLQGLCSDHEADILSTVENAQKLALVHLPLSAAAVHSANPVLDHVDVAPQFVASWSQMRGHLGNIVHRQKLIGDQVLIVGDTGLEREWVAAAQAAGYLEAARYFGV